MSVYCCLLAILWRPVEEFERVDVCVCAYASGEKSVRNVEIHCFLYPFLSLSLFLLSIGKFRNYIALHCTIDHQSWVMSDAFFLSPCFFPCISHFVLLTICSSLHLKAKKNPEEQTNRQIELHTTIADDMTHVNKQKTTTKHERKEIRRTTKPSSY